MSRESVLEYQVLDRGLRAHLARRVDAAAGRWRTLNRVAAIAALGIVALVPVQVIVFVLWPPPDNVLDYFAVFQANAVRGLLDLDILMIVDELLFVPILLALYWALRRTDESLSLLGTALGLGGVALILVSREATVSMYWLSQQYAAADSPAMKAALVAAGQTLLTTYNGTAFTIGYVMSGLAMLLLSMVMLRGTTFSRATGWAGVLAGAAGLVPATFGTLGLALSFISLLPMLVWLALMARTFPRLAPRRRPELA